MKLPRRNIIAAALMVVIVATFLPGTVAAQNTSANRSSFFSEENYENIVNGLVFRGEMGMYGEKDGEDAELSFRGGALHSKLMEEHGFAPSSYTIEKGLDKYTINFYSESTNKKGDRLIWHGKIKLDHTGLIKRHKVEAYATCVKAGELCMLVWLNGEATEQSMKYAGQNVPSKTQTASRDSSK